MVKNNHFKAVIFDLDGTLINSLESIAMGVNTVLSELSLKTHTLEDYRKFIGNGVRELIRQALISSGDTELKFFEKALELHKAAYKKYALYKLVPYEGINEVLKELKKNNILIAVNTNKPQDRAVEVVNIIFGEDMFDIIVGQVDERPRKPAPDGCLYIADKLGLQPCECIYIGDTEVDMKTGKSAGMYTVGATWGFRTRKELEENDADLIIAEPMELINCI